MSIKDLTRQSAAKTIREKLVAIGIPPPTGERFDRMLRTSEAASTGNDPAEQEVLIRAEKELQELHVILDTLAVQPLSPELRKRLRIVVENDPIHPEGTDDSPGRDTQFELLTEAVLTRAQMKPLRPQGDGLADFTVHTSVARHYAVEAKRIKADAGVERNFMKACNQIEATGLTGFVIMDLGPVLHAGLDAIQTPMPDDEFRKRVFAELKKFFDRHLPGLRRIRKRRPVRSIQAVNWFIRRSKEQGWGLDTVQYGVPLDEYHQARRIEHLVFQDQLNRGLPGTTEIVDELTAVVRQASTVGANLARLLPRE